MKLSRLFVVPLVAALVLAGCGDGDDSGTPKPDAAASVFVVPGLTPLATDLLTAYKKQNPASKLTVVTENLKPMENGVTARKPGVSIAPSEWLTKVSATNKLQDQALGRTLLVLAVPSDNPRGVTSLALYKSGAGLRKATCGLLTPPGCFVTVPRQLAAKQLDAALIFRGGLQLPPGVKTISIRDDENLIIDVGYVVVGQTDEVQGFSDFLESDAAKDILTAKGYLP